MTLGLAHLPLSKESILMCFPGGMHAYGEGNGAIFSEYREHLSPEGQASTPVGCVPSKGQGHLSKGQ